MGPYRTFLTQRFTASAPTGLVVLHRLLLILIALLALIWVQDAWAGPPTDQLRDGVERVVKVLTDPELRGDTKVNERNAAITHSIVDLGHRLGLNVVAEGVQTEEAWTRLAEWGCDEVQGHLLGRPMTAAQLDPWLRAVAGRPARTSGPPVWPAA